MKNKSRNSRTSLALLLAALFSIAASAQEDYRDAFSASATFSSQNEADVPSIFGPTMDRNRFKASVKVYNNGDVQLENIEWAPVTFKQEVDWLGVDVEADALEFYREEIHRQMGAELGMRVLDATARKVVDLEGLESARVIIEGRAALTKVTSVRTGEQNYFVRNQDAYLQDEEPGVYRNAYGLDVEVKAGVEYDRDHMSFSAEGYYQRYGNRDLQTSDGNQFNYGKKEYGVKFTFTPDREKCHRLSVGARSMEFNQGFNTMNDGFGSDEIYVNYECKFDVKKMFWGIGAKKDRNTMIRF